MFSGLELLHLRAPRLAPQTSAREETQTQGSFLSWPGRAPGRGSRAHRLALPSRRTLHVPATPPALLFSGNPGRSRSAPQASCPALTTPRAMGPDSPAQQHHHQTLSIPAGMFARGPHRGAWPLTEPLLWPPGVLRGQAAQGLTGVGTLLHFPPCPLGPRPPCREGSCPSTLP